jgi:hypothetical protein
MREYYRDWKDRTGFLTDGVNDDQITGAQAVVDRHAGPKKRSSFKEVQP